MGNFQVRIGAGFPLDGFLAAGQSNEAGIATQPELAPVPAIGEGLEYVVASRTFVRLAEPLRANIGTTAEGRGGPWSAFAVEWKRLTGRQAVIFQKGKVGSAQEAAAQIGGNGHWQPGGAGTPNHYSAALTEIPNFLADLDARPEPFVFRGMIWGQGGTDAQEFDKGTAGVTKQNYKDQFTAMLAGLRTNLGLPNLPVFWVRLGRPNSADTTGFSTIRDAQEELDTADPLVNIVWRGAVDYPSRGLMQDSVHYTQAGYNEEGTLAAQGVAALI